MIEKFRKNFSLANVAVKVLFALTFVFAFWQTSAAAALSLTGEADPLLTFGSSLVLGVLLMFLFPAVVGLLLNVCKIYSVPRNEYCLLATAFCALNYFILGVLNLVNIFTPILLVWGGAVFPVISSFIATLLFYKLTVKLYFNDLTALHYFKTVATIYIVCTVLFGVIL